MVRTLYLDASALVKLIRAEPESEPLRAALPADDRRVSSVVASIEVAVVARRGGGHGAVQQADLVMDAVEKIELSPAVVRRASRTVGLRALDAIHLASALELGGHLDAMITYDRRLAAAAAAAGVPVVAPR